MGRLWRAIPRQCLCAAVAFLTFDLFLPPFLKKGAQPPPTFRPVYCGQTATLLSYYLLYYHYYYSIMCFTYMLRTVVFYFLLETWFYIAKIQWIFPCPEPLTSQRFHKNSPITLCNPADKQTDKRRQIHNRASRRKWTNRGIEGQRWYDAWSIAWDQINY